MQEFKVLLIRPRYSYVYGSHAKAAKFMALQPPAALIQLSACLENHDISNNIIDAELENYSDNTLLQIIKTSNCKIVGLTSTTPEINYVLSLVEKIKSIFPEKLVALGGPHAIILPETTITNDFVDIVCCGEGETYFTEFVKKFISNTIDGSPIRNIYYKYNSKIIAPPSALFYEDINDLPYPSFHKVDLNRYTYPAPYPLRRKTPYYSLFTSRGCPYHCAYCCKTMGEKVRLMSVEKVIHLLEILRYKHKIFFIHFTDDIFTINKKRAVKICNLIISKKLDIYWYCNLRADLVDLETLTIMRKAGCVRVTFGVETLNQKSLDILKKNIYVSDYFNAYTLAKKVGLETRASFMIGIPYENKKDIINTITLCKTLPIDEASFYILTPYPKTDIYKMATRGEGIRLLSENFSYFRRWENAIIELPDLPPNELKKLQKYAIRSFYLRPKSLLHLFKRIRFIDLIKSIFYLAPSMK